MLKDNQSIDTSVLDWRIKVVLPNWLIAALPDTTLPPSGWLVLLNPAPHTGVRQGKAARAADGACVMGTPACPSGDNASDIAAAATSRPTLDRLRADRPRPDRPRPALPRDRIVSATGIQAPRASLKISR
jgi:hypothetical protein